MTDAGYVVDVPYSSAFTPAQAPLAQAVALSLAGYCGPDPRRPFKYLELCCGEAITLCVLAACYPSGRFIGVDVNARHIGLAQERAERCGLSNIEFVLADVLDFEASSGDLDFIAILGAYSWLDPSRQRAVLQIAERRLAQRGALLLHYASMPGALQSQALHQALAWLSPEVGGSVERLRGAFATLDPYTNSRFFQFNPVAARRLKEVQQAPPADVAHEVLSQGAGALWFGEVMAQAQGACLRPVVEADTFEPIWHGDVAGADIVRRQTLRDLELCRLSRQDILMRSGEIGQTGEAHSVFDWYAPPRVRGEPSKLAAALRISHDQAAAILALANGDRPAAGPDVDEAFTKLLRRALHRGVLQPKLWPARARPKNDRMSSFNQFALEYGLKSSSRLPLAAHALGSQLVLPAPERLQLFAWSGGDVNGVFAALRSDQREACYRLLSDDAMARFERQALSELRTLGVIGELGPEDLI